MEAWIVLQYGGLLILALYALLRGADAFIAGARSLGVRMGVQPFVIGVCIVGLGTSLPELASSLAAIVAGAEEVVVANVVGSNIANILLVGGLLGLLAGPLVVRKDMLRTELPLFAMVTLFFLLILHDGTVTRTEGVLLVGMLLAYGWYLLTRDVERVGEQVADETAHTYKTYDALTMVLAGALIVMIGAHYTVVSLMALADVLLVSVSALAIVLIAFGTSLPEIAVSYQAVRAGQVEMAIGNLFGSNAFNILLVGGVSALFTPLSVAPVVLELGIYVLIVASVVFFVLGLARQIMPWEGAMLLLVYGYFLIQLGYFL